MQKPKVVILTGAGISAESGIPTFRGVDGLWEGHRIEDVASPEGFLRDPETVQRFYNTRRADVRKARPNAGHLALVALEKKFDVHIITQNIDDLHERAGSKNVLHLHGEIMKSQSSSDPQKVYVIKGDDIRMGDLCPAGAQLRPHVVWFGESVPNMKEAIKLTNAADVFIVIGTSLQVYPAANLIFETKKECEIYLIDPNASTLNVGKRVVLINETACAAVPELVKMLTK